MSRKSLEIKLARAYDALQTKDRYRVLVDRLWPRGIKKEKLLLDDWLKDIAPSDDLRKWFNHDPERWEEFRTRYHAELKDKSDLVDQLLKTARTRPILLLFGAKDTEHNNAVALKQFLEKRDDA